MKSPALACSITSQWCHVTPMPWFLAPFCDIPSPIVNQVRLLNHQAVNPTKSPYVSSLKPHFRWNHAKSPFSYGFPMVFPWFSHGFPMLRTPGPPLRGVVDEDPQRRAQQRRLVLRSVGGGRQGVGAALDGLVPKGIRVPTGSPGWFHGKTWWFQLETYKVVPHS